LKRSRIVLTTIVLLVVTNLVTYTLATGVIPFVNVRWGTGILNFGPARDAAKLRQEFELLTTRYVEPVDPKVLIEGALKGMAEAVGDPYTYYMNPQEYKSFDVTLEGEYGGVGMVVEQVGDYVTVITPLRGSPAERAGIQPRDRIVAVDGRDVTRVPSDIVADLIRGKPGTKVTLTIARGPLDDEVRFDVPLVREKIILESAFGKMLYPAEGIGYLRITDFSRNTPEQFGAALADLRSQGLKALVLDLRNNGGGYLDECVTIANTFVTEGPILHRVGRDGRMRAVEASGREPLGLPLVVLVNELTASAAEILAGAIQEHEAGRLVGTVTFGKGTVQTPYQLGDGSVLRLTTERWLTPDGNQITGKGITPDEIVELPEIKPDEKPLTWSDPTDPRDTQLRRAVEVLRATLARPSEG